MKKILLLLRPENTENKNRQYIKAIEKFGGEVMLVYDSDEKSDVLQKLPIVDGILLPGGDDIGKLDFFLIDYAISHNLNLLGICQGMQSMAIYHTKNKLEPVFNHYLVEHPIYLNESNLKKIIGKDKLVVNSYHHQQVKESKEFKVVAISKDGVIEAIENSEHKFQIGVEWHPERNLDQKENQKIFETFLS